MNAVIILVILTTLAQAGLIPTLPPILGRDEFQNSALHVSAGRNAMLVSDKPTQDYNTVQYRAYIAFLVLGIVLAVLFLPVVLSRSIVGWYCKEQEKKKVQQRNVDMETATAQMRAMTQPEVVHLRPERAG
ncbi:uncharacterized protein EKO05_0000821 [Ascochyta rabiei]|uniref:Uncharacterized protein n=1 Tax=Didymella rabiei TaxID=5454 RepID=A0A163CID5_DIDRA|nr:uncharacterized protein EKO05_0000821 [Ascochyta rabiei]KZM22485.1 hypothetical protein ST47_g6378 [Ascochyta rabiei]UPX10150.1 hypothetical protein EKO05_0000821 [Ascochyta rabiei]